MIWEYFWFCFNFRKCFVNNFILSEQISLTPEFFHFFVNSLDTIYSLASLFLSLKFSPFPVFHHTKLHRTRIKAKKYCVIYVRFTSVVSFPSRSALALHQFHSFTIFSTTVQKLIKDWRPRQNHPSPSSFLVSRLPLVVEWSARSYSVFNSKTQSWSQRLQSKNWWIRTGRDRDWPLWKRISVPSAEGSFAFWSLTSTSFSILRNWIHLLLTQNFRSDLCTSRNDFNGCWLHLVLIIQSCPLFRTGASGRFDLARAFKVERTCRILVGDLDNSLSKHGNCRVQFQNEKWNKLELKSEGGPQISRIWHKNATWHCIQFFIVHWWTSNASIKSFHLKSKLDESLLFERSKTERFAVGIRAPGGEILREIHWISDNRENEQEYNEFHPFSPNPSFRGQTMRNSAKKAQ